MRILLLALFVFTSICSQGQTILYNTPDNANRNDFIAITFVGESIDFTNGSATMLFTPKTTNPDSLRPFSFTNPSVATDTFWTENIFIPDSATFGDYDIEIRLFDQFSAFYVFNLYSKFCIGSAVGVVDAGLQDSLCAGGSIMLNGSQTEPNPFQWTGGGVFSPSASTLNPTYTPSFAEEASGFAMLYLSVTGPTACPRTDSVRIDIDDIPNQPSGIASVGPVECESSSAQYQISPVSGATNYTWTVNSGAFLNTGQGTTFIDVTCGSELDMVDIDVTASNYCGTSPAENYSIFVEGYPSGFITGPSEGCVGSSDTYVWSPSSGFNYSDSWSTTGGASVNTFSFGTADVDFISSGPATVDIMITNACGSTSDSYPITLQDAATPTFITYDASFCGAADGQIEVQNLNSSEGYLVNYTGVSSGAGGGNVINTDFSGTLFISGLTADDYSNFTFDNTVCTSIASGVQTISQPGVPSYTVSTQTNPTTCLGSDGSILLTGLSATYSYNLDYFTGAGSSGIIPIVTDGAGEYLISALSAETYFNINIEDAGCIRTDPGSYTLVGPAPGSAGLISGVNPACEGESENYSIGAVADATNYTWVQPTGSVISFGQGTNSIILDLGSTSGNLSVTPSNSCGTGTSSSVILTIDPRPTVSAGTDQTLCSTSLPFALNGGSTNSTGISWSNGTGVYTPNNLTANASYSPSAPELSAGIVTLAITNTGTGVCPAAIDSVDLTIINSVISLVPDSQSVEVPDISTLSPLLNDTVGAGDSLVITKLSFGSGFLSSLLSNDSTMVNYVMSTGFLGVDSLFYTAENGCGDRDSTYIKITILNSPPSFNSPGGVATFNTGLFSFDLLPYLTDTNQNLDINTVIIDSTYSGKVATISGVTVVEVDYFGFSGQDTIYFTVCDSLSSCSSGKLSVLVNTISTPSVDIVVHNAISPGNDNLNDYLQIDNIEYYLDNEIWIYNKWGVELYHSTGYNNSDVRWDARIKGAPIATGSYYYFLKVNELDLKESGYIEVRIE